MALVSVFEEGDSAPDAPITTSDGTQTTLSAVWQEHNGPTVLVFLRHFGCIFCREHAAQLAEVKPAFDQQGVQIVFVGMGNPAEAREFQADRNLPFEILADPDRVAYRAFGLPEGRVSQLAGPSVVGASLRAMKNGAGVGKAIGNRRQLPGTYIVDQNGSLLFARPAAHAGDIADVETIMAALKAAPEASVEAIGEPMPA